MQVPAGAVAEKSVTDTVAGSSSSLFAMQSDAATTKTGLLPSFAQLFSDHSTGGNMGSPAMEDVGGLENSAANSTVLLQEASALAELRHKSLPVKLLDELQSAASMQVGGDQSAFKSTKSESKSTRGRRVGEAHSSTLEKKAHSASSHVESSMLASSFSVATTQIQSATAPALKINASLGLHLPPVSSASQQVISIPQVQKGEHFSEQGLGQGSLLSANPDKSFLSMTDVLTPAMQHADIAAQTYSSHLPAKIQSAEIPVALPEVSSSFSRNSNEVKTSPARALETDKKNDILKVADIAGQKTDTAETAAVISKLKKEPEKMGEARDGTTVPMQSSSARVALMEVARMNDNVSLGSVALHGAVTNSAKQTELPPDTNAFQQLDSGPAPAATVLHSSAHQIAVGIHDPALGWLEVQTQSSAGHINATLTATTTEAHMHLAAQAPAITQYLADRQVFVHSLNVHTHSDAQNGSSSGGQPHTGTGNAREQASGRGEILEARPIKAPKAAGEVNLGKVSDASYISVHA